VKSCPLSPGRAGLAQQTSCQPAKAAPTPEARPVSAGSLLPEQQRGEQACCPASSPLPRGGPPDTRPRDGAPGARPLAAAARLASGRPGAVAGRCWHGSCLYEGQIRPTTQR